MEGVYKMRITCLYKLVETDRYKKIITNYIRSCYPNNYHWKFNSNRLIWHVKNNSTLREWATGKGIKFI